MSQDTCLLQKSRGFQFDRGKNYLKKNCAFWFGFAQIQELKEKENKSSKTPVETLRKTDRSTGKNSQRYEKLKWLLDMLWLIDCDGNLAHELLLRLLLVTLIYFKIALLNITNQNLGQNQQKIIRIIVKSVRFFTMINTLKSRLPWQLWLGFINVLPPTVRFFTMSNTYKTRSSWQLWLGFINVLPQMFGFSP